MTSQPNRPVREFVPAGLAASCAGIWYRDIAHDRSFYCPIAAQLLHLPREECEQGVSLEQFAWAISADDQARFRSTLAGKAMRNPSDDQYRVVSGSGIVRILFSRARYEIDADGSVSCVRGILIAMSDRDQPAASRDAALGSFDLADKDGMALDIAAEHALVVREAIDRLGLGESSRLRMAADGLLIELGRHIAAALAEERRYDA